MLASASRGLLLSFSDYCGYQISSVVFIFACFVYAQFMTLRRLNIKIQGLPESYATEPYMGDSMVIGEPHPVPGSIPLPPESSTSRGPLLGQPPDRPSSSPVAQQQSQEVGPPNPAAPPLGEPSTPDRPGSAQQQQQPPPPPPTTSLSTPPDGSTNVEEPPDPVRSSPTTTTTAANTEEGTNATTTTAEAVTTATGMKRDVGVGDGEVVGPPASTEEEQHQSPPQEAV